MAKVYETLLLNNLRTWEQVPNILKPPVKIILKQDVIDGIITAERYKEIVGEKYVA